MTEQRRLGWKFLNKHGFMAHDMAHIQVKAGLEVWLKGNRTIEACKYGFHYSERAIDTLLFVNSNWLARVEDIGDQRDTSEKGKVATNGLFYVSGAVDVERVLHEFAIWCAEQVLVLIDDPAPCLLQVLEAKRRWLDGEVTDEELAAASVVDFDVTKDASWHSFQDIAPVIIWAATRNIDWTAAVFDDWNLWWAAKKGGSMNNVRAAQNAKLEMMLVPLFERTPA